MEGMPEEGHRQLHAMFPVCAGKKVAHHMVRVWPEGNRGSLTRLRVTIDGGIPLLLLSGKWDSSIGIGIGSAASGTEATVGGGGGVGGGEDTCTPTHKQTCTMCHEIHALHALSRMGEEGVWKTVWRNAWEITKQCLLCSS